MSDSSRFLSEHMNDGDRLVCARAMGIAWYVHERWGSLGMHVSDGNRFMFVCMNDGDRLLCVSDCICACAHERWGSLDVC